MKASHVGTDPSRCAEWFECPRCHFRQVVTMEAWCHVPVIGRKPALRCSCGLDAHIPPAPATIEAHNREVAILELMTAVAKGEGGKP